MAKRLPRPDRRRLQLDYQKSDSIITMFVGQVRRPTELPAQACTSRAIVIDKKGTVPTGQPVADVHQCVRLLHCFDHFWCLHLRNGLNKYGSLCDAPPWACGELTRADVNH